MPRTLTDSIIIFETDEATDEELAFDVKFSFLPGQPASGPSYSSGGEPAEGPEIEILSVTCIHEDNTTDVLPKWDEHDADRWTLFILENWQPADTEADHADYLRDLAKDRALDDY